MTVDKKVEDIEETTVEEAAPAKKKAAPRARKRKKRDDSGISDDLPLLPLRGVVVYPMMWLPLTIGQLLNRHHQLVPDRHHVTTQ